MKESALPDLFDAVGNVNLLQIGTFHESIVPNPDDPVRDLNSLQIGTTVENSLNFRGTLREG